jgi:hypothetical protein
MQEINDTLIEEALRNGTIKRCPNCQVYTEKISGCNYLECTLCKAQWCWQCIRLKNFSPAGDTTINCSEPTHNSHS